MALKKKRGRKPSKRTLKKRSQLKQNRHWLDCSQCGMEGAEVDGDISVLICSTCVAKMVPPPPKPRQPLSKEEKELRAARKIERAKQKAAKKAGLTLETKDLGFGRGWHRKALFTTKIDGKARYFSFGKEIKKREFDKLSRARAKDEAAKIKMSTGWGRGWHLKGEFISPDGDIYESGSLRKKASKEPTLEEFQTLMEQHS